MYKLSARSLERLRGVHPDLVRVVRCAITLTAVDFGVSEGLRDVARQRELVAAGASTTMDSRHLTGHAVDLAAYIGAEVRWDWPLYHRLAAAMQQAARMEAVPLRWGGCWDRPLNDLGDPAAAHADYIARRQAAGQRAFTDGPHFELPAAVYPARGAT